MDIAIKTVNTAKIDATLRAMGSDELVAIYNKASGKAYKSCPVAAYYRYEIKNLLVNRDPVAYATI